MNSSLRFGAVLSSCLALTLGCGDPSPVDPGFGAGGSDVVVGVTANASHASNAATGGGGTSESALLFTSGTRLRARFLDGGGAARMFEGWFDTELGIDCTSTPVAGEPNRCLPPLLEGRVFLDAACALPAVESAVFEPGGAPKYTVEATSGAQTCDAYRALAVGDAEVVASVFVKDASGACAEILEERTVHPLEPATLDVFARLDVVDAPGFPVGAREERGPDGAYRLVAGVLPGQGGPCRAMSVEFGGEPHCVPISRVRDAATFASGCADPAIPLDACELTQLQPITDVRVDACGRRAAIVHQPGPIVDEVFLADGSPSCNAVSLGRGRRLGAPTDGYFYPQGWEAFAYGPELFVSGLSVAPTFFGAVDGRPCDVTETAAGLRCVPPLVPRPTRFSDDACTSPLAAAPPTDCWPPPIMGKYGSDGRLVSVGQVGPEHQGPVYQGGGAEPCTLVAEGATGWFYMIGEFPVDTLPALVHRME